MERKAHRWGTSGGKVLRVKPDRHPGRHNFIDPAPGPGGEGVNEFFGFFL